MRPYHAYDLCFAADFALPYPTREAGPAFTLRCGPAAAEPFCADFFRDHQLLHEAAELTPGDFTRLSLENEIYYLSSPQWHTSFSPPQREIVFTPHPSTAPDTLPGFIERLFLPLFTLLARPSAIALHGGAIGWHDQAWLFLGASMSGKSTLVARLVEAGGQLLADDLTLVDVAQGVVLPGATTLYVRNAALVPSNTLAQAPLPLNPTKIRCVLPPRCVAPQPLPLARIFLLTPGLAPGPLRGAAGVTELLRNVFMLTHGGAEWSTRRTRHAADLARRFPPEALAHLRGPDNFGSSLGALVARAAEVD